MSISYRKLLNRLIAMHTSKRPHGTRTERRWSKHWVGNLPGAYMDTYGNYHVHVDDSPILWSCHTDTVHRHQGSQRVAFDQATGKLSLSVREHDANCLGADCTAGVFLMRELVLRHVPGHYIFHYGEESGGIGSRKIALHHAEWLTTFKCAIALDRRGYSDVITHQSMGRTASDTFADSLALLLPGKYESDPSGIYTDTAEYADDIAECTNLSVGYFGAHSDKETLDCYHVLRLLDSLTQVRVDSLIIARTPGDWDLDSHSYLYHSWDSWYEGKDGTWSKSSTSITRKLLPCPNCDTYNASDTVRCKHCTLDLLPTDTNSGWDCDYCAEWNDPDDITCTWCGKPQTYDPDAALYLTPESAEVSKALSTTCLCKPVTCGGIVAHRAFCPMAQSQATLSLRSITPACTCKRNKDPRGVIQHSLDCAVTQSIVGG